MEVDGYIAFIPIPGALSLSTCYYTIILSSVICSDVVITILKWPANILAP